MRSAQSTYMPKDIQTDVYVYLGDCSGDSLPLVCEGVAPLCALRVGPGAMLGPY